MRTHSSFRRLSGFTLVELLAVVAIIGIMAAVIGVGMRSNDSYSVRAGQRVASSMFMAARTIATSRQTEARVIIYADGGGADLTSKYCRFMGVVYWGDPDPYNTNDTERDWVPANSGTYLPDGVYYIPPGVGSSGGSVEGGSFERSSSDAGNILASETVPTMSLKFPVASASRADTWWYYAFDGPGTAREMPSGSGIPGSNGDSFAGKIFVIAAGHPGPPSAGGPTIVIDNAYNTAGLAIRRIGGTMVLSDYDYVEDAL